MTDKNPENDFVQEHRKFAVDCFNGTWALIDKEKRTKEEDDKMIHMAHASRFHWGEIGTPVEIERGEWLISRVYSILKRPEPAFYHAKRCLAICELNQIGDLDIVFAHEALARAYITAGKRPKAVEHLAIGREAVRDIRETNDREYAQTELDDVSNLID